MLPMPTGGGSVSSLIVTGMASLAFSVLSLDVVGRHMDMPPIVFMTFVAMSHSSMFADCCTLPLRAFFRIGYLSFIVMDGAA